MQGKTFYFAIISFALGVALHSVLNISGFLIALGIVISSAFFIYALYLKRFWGEKSGFKLFFVLALVLSMFVFGLIRFHLDTLKGSDLTLDSYLGQSVKVEGVISEEPDERENNVRYVVDLNKIILGGKEVPVSSRAIVTADFYPKFSYGDSLAITGILEKPENFLSDLGREFDYVSYLSKDGIYYQMYRPGVRVVSTGGGSLIRRNLINLKQKFLELLQENIPEPEVSLSGGLLLGTKRSLGAQKLDDFRKVGLIHIVVLSGYNVSLVAEFFIAGLSLFLSPLFSGIFGALGILLFAILVGGGATVIRASIMALLVILARLTRRNYEVERGLFLAGFLMLIANPRILISDPSFQLSFMATLGLIYVSPILERYFTFVTTKYKLRELFVATISTQIFVLPLILYMTGQLSLLALPANILVLGIVPFAMLFSFITGLFGLLLPVLATPFGFVSYLMLSYILKITDLFARIPFVAVTIKYFPFWLMVLFYIFYGFVIRFLLKANTKKQKAI